MLFSELTAASGVLPVPAGADAHISTFLSPDPPPWPRFMVDIIGPDHPQPTRYVGPDWPTPPQYQGTVGPDWPTPVSATSLADNANLRVISSLDPDWPPPTQYQGTVSPDYPPPQKLNACIVNSGFVAPLVSPDPPPWPK